jgi:hypothetical protein
MIIQLQESRFTLLIFYLGVLAGVPSGHRVCFCQNLFCHFQSYSPIKPVLRLVLELVWSGFALHM